MIPTDVIAEYQIAFRPPFNDEVSTRLFSRRVVSMSPPKRSEDLRLSVIERALLKNRVERAYLELAQCGKVELGSVLEWIARPRHRISLIA